MQKIPAAERRTIRSYQEVPSLSVLVKALIDTLVNLGMAQFRVTYRSDELRIVSPKTRLSKADFTMLQSGTMHVYLY